MVPATRCSLAEGERFELSMPVKAYRFSRPTVSAISPTLPKNPHLITLRVLAHIKSRLFLLRSDAQTNQKIGKFVQKI